MKQTFEEKVKKRKEKEISTKGKTKFRTKKVKRVKPNFFQFNSSKSLIEVEIDVQQKIREPIEIFKQPFNSNRDVHYHFPHWSI